MIACDSDRPPASNSLSLVGLYYEAIDDTLFVDGGDSFTLSSDDITCTMDETVEIRVSVVGHDFVERTGYYMNRNAAEWTKFDFQGTRAGTYIQGDAFYTIKIPCSEIARQGSATFKVAARSWNRVQSGWDNNDGRAMLQLFDINFVHESCIDHGSEVQYVRGSESRTYLNECLSETTYISYSCDGSNVISETQDCALCSRGVCSTGPSAPPPSPVSPPGYGRSSSLIEVSPGVQLPVFAASCLGPDSRSIPHEGSRVYYQSSSATECVSELRTCNNGVLSGSFEYATCHARSSRIASVAGATVLVEESGFSSAVLESSDKEEIDAASPEPQAPSSEVVSEAEVIESLELQSEVSEFSSIPVGFDGILSPERVVADTAINLHYAFLDQTHHLLFNFTSSISGNYFLRIGDSFIRYISPFDKYGPFYFVSLENQNLPLDSTVRVCSDEFSLASCSNGIRMSSSSDVRSCLYPGQFIPANDDSKEYLVCGASLTPSSEVYTCPFGFELAQGSCGPLYGVSPEETVSVEDGVSFTLDINKNYKVLFEGVEYFWDDGIFYREGYGAMNPSLQAQGSPMSNNYAFLDGNIVRLKDARSGSHTYSLSLPGSEINITSIKMVDSSYLRLPAYFYIEGTIPYDRTMVVIPVEPEIATPRFRQPLFDYSGGGSRETEIQSLNDNTHLLFSSNDPEPIIGLNDPLRRHTSFDFSLGDSVRLCELAGSSRPGVITSAENTLVSCSNPVVISDASDLTLEKSDDLGIESIELKKVSPSPISPRDVFGEALQEQIDQNDPYPYLVELQNDWDNNRFYGQSLPDAFVQGYSFSTKQNISLSQGQVSIHRTRLNTMTWSFSNPENLPLVLVSINPDSEILQFSHGVQGNSLTGGIFEYLLRNGADAGFYRSGSSINGVWYNTSQSLRTNIVNLKDASSQHSDPVIFPDLASAFGVCGFRSYNSIVCSNGLDFGDLIPPFGESFISADADYLTRFSDLTRHKNNWPSELITQSTPWSEIVGSYTQTITPSGFTCTGDCPQGVTSVPVSSFDLFSSRFEETIVDLNPPVGAEWIFDGDVVSLVLPTSSGEFIPRATGMSNTHQICSVGSVARPIVAAGNSNAAGSQVGSTTYNCVQIPGAEAGIGYWTDGSLQPPTKELIYHEDCSFIHNGMLREGTHNTVGMHSANGVDERFLCYDGRFYGCGVEGIYEARPSNWNLFSEGQGGEKIQHHSALTRGIWVYSSQHCPGTPSHAPCRFRRTEAPPDQSLVPWSCEPLHEAWYLK